MEEEEKRFREAVALTAVSPTYQEIPMTEAEEKFLDQLNPEKINEYIENKLRGKIWDSKKKQWVDPPFPVKRIKEEGISEIMTRVWSIINPNTIYSNLDDDMIRTMVYDFGVELSRYLGLKYKEFGMEVVDINKVTNFCCNMAYIAMKRGEQALTLRILRTMIQAKEIVATTQKTEEQKSFLEKLFKK